MLLLGWLREHTVYLVQRGNPYHQTDQRYLPTSHCPLGATPAGLPHCHPNTAFSSRTKQNHLNFIIQINLILKSVYIASAIISSTEEIIYINIHQYSRHFEKQRECDRTGRRISKKYLDMLFFK